MTRIEKLVSKFEKNYKSVSLSQLEKILEYFGFLKIQAKGSHVKYKHGKLVSDLIIPKHGTGCKEKYKELALKQIKKL